MRLGQSDQTFLSILIISFPSQDTWPAEKSPKYTRARKSLSPTECDDTEPFVSFLMVVLLLLISYFYYSFYLYHYYFFYY